MKKDNIIIKKIWQDIDFYEVQFKIKSQQINCEFNTYVVDKEINELSKKILDTVSILPATKALPS